MWLIGHLRARRRGQAVASPRLPTAWIAWRDAYRTTRSARANALLILPYIEQNALYTQANVASYPGVVGVPASYAAVNNSWRAVGG